MWLAFGPRTLAGVADCFGSNCAQLEEAASRGHKRAIEASLHASQPLTVVSQLS